jgi:hypothetical protein
MSMSSEEQDLELEASEDFEESGEDFEESGEEDNALLQKYQSSFQQKSLEIFQTRGNLACDACRDAGGKGSHRTFSLQGLLGHAASKPGRCHHAYKKALKQFMEAGAAAAEGGGSTQRGPVDVSVKVTQGQTADAPESGEVSLPPLLVVGNTETTRSPGVMKGLNGHDMSEKLRESGYDVRKIFSTYRAGGCDNLGFAVFEESLNGLREAATLAQDMERAGFGREAFNRAWPESLVEADGSKILFTWQPTPQVRT